MILERDQLVWWLRSSGIKSKRIPRYRYTVVPARVIDPALRGPKGQHLARIYCDDLASDRVVFADNLFSSPAIAEREIAMRVLSQ